MSKPVILTGLRANSEFHLGNYLGAILPMIELQNRHAGKYQVNMFVPDLHSFTTPIDHTQLYRQIIDNIKLYAAAGLDISNPDIFVYRQSYIPAHSELTLILNNFAYFGELSRMTQFKDKSESEKEQNVTAGLFDYPVLMAADILLYGAEWVPVGEDQRQHLELTRDLAIRMNNKFGELFTVPHEWQKQLDFAAHTTGIRIRSLRYPDKKMSKSVEDPAGTILLSDNPDEAAKKIMSATTDSAGVIHYNWDNQPGISNLLQISALLAKQPIDEAAKAWEGKASYGELKTHVAAQVQEFLNDLQAGLATVDEAALLQKLEQDEAVMSALAHTTLEKVQKAVGLRP